MDTALFEEIFIYSTSLKNYKKIIKDKNLMFAEGDGWAGSHYIAFVSKTKHIFIGFVKVTSIQRIDNDETSMSLVVNIGKPFSPFDKDADLPGKLKGKNHFLKQYISWENLFNFKKKDFYQKHDRSYMFITVSKEFQNEYNLPEKIPVVTNGIYQSIGTNQIPIEAIIGGIEEFLVSGETADPEKIKAYKLFLMKNYIDIAQDYMKKRNFVTALDLFKKVQKMFPEESIVYYHLGVYYLEKQEPDLAEEMLRKAIELDPKNLLAYNYLGATYAFEEKFERAIEVWKRSLNIEPDNLLILMNIGKALLNTRKFQEATRYFKRSIEIEDKNIQAFNFLALCYANQGSTVEAIENWKTVLRLGGGDSYLYYNLGRACSEADFYTVGIYMLEKAVEMFSENDSKLKDISLKKIKKLFQQLNKLRDNDFEIYMKFMEKQYNIKIIGLTKELCEIIDITEIDDFFAAELFRNRVLFNSIHIKEGGVNNFEFDESREEMNITIKKEYVQANKIITPLVISLIRDGIMLIQRMDSESQRENIEKNIRKNLINESMSKYGSTNEEESESAENISQAIEAMKEKLRNDPDNGWLHYTLGSLYGQIGNFTDSLEEFKIAANINPKNSIAWHSCGAIYARLNMEEEAIESYKRAITVPHNEELEEIYKKWNYNNSFAYFDMAEIYLRKDKTDEAIIMFNKGLSIDLKNYLAHYQLGNCYLKKEKLTDALQSFKNSVTLQSNFASGYNRIGYIYYLLEKWNDSLENFKLAYGYDPNDPDTIFFLGQIHFLNGNYEEAIKYLQFIVTHVQEPRYVDLAQDILDKLDY